MNWPFNCRCDGGEVPTGFEMLVRDGAEDKAARPAVGPGEVKAGKENRSTAKVPAMARAADRRTAAGRLRGRLPTVSRIL